MPITNKDLKAYGLPNMIISYYNLIIESKINGNSSQCAGQFKALSRDQRKDCLIYMAGAILEGDREYSPKDVHAAIGICIESIY